MANCKYIKEQEIVSYNGGVDWQDVMPPQYRKGQLVEHDSEYCTEIDTIYRWRKLTGVYLCVDDMKYEKLILDESYDNGLSWYPAYPSQYATGEAIGIDENYCNDKFVGHYYMDNETHKCPSGYEWDGHRCSSTYIEPNNNHRRKDPIKIVKCDGNPELTSADTKYYSSYPSNYKFYLFSAEIGKCVTSIAASAFTNSSALTYVYMADSVTSIGNSAFSKCGSLSGMNTTIPGVLNIPSGVTSIGNSTFSSCSGLTSVTIGSSVISIGESAFRNCSGLTSVIIPNGVTSIGNNAFNNCSGLTSVTIGSGVTVIGGAAFKDCSGLTSITCLATTPPSLGGSYWTSADTFDGSTCTIFVPCESLLLYINNARWKKYANRVQGLPPCEMPFKWKATYSDGHITSAVCDSTSTISGLGGAGFVSIEIGQCVNTIGESAFWNCSSLTSVTIPSGVTSIGRDAFSKCTSLSSVTIPDNVTSLGDDAFYDCSRLRSCTIGNGVSGIGRATFEYCYSLKNVTLGSGVTSIGDYAFNDCSGLTSMTIYSTTPPSLGYWALQGTPGTMKIFVPGCSVETYKTAPNWMLFASRTYPIPETITYRWVDDGFVCIYQDKWKQMKEQWSCDNTTWYDSGVVSATSLIEADSMDCISSTYFGFKALQNGTFRFTESINYSVDKGVTWNTLEANTDSPTVTTGNKIIWKGTSTPTSGSGIGTFSSTGNFEVIGNIMSLLFGDDFIDKTSLRNKSYAFKKLFYGCTGLTSIEHLCLPATVTEINCYQNMFQGCTGLTSIPSGLLPATSVVRYCYDNMFSNCRNLTEIPDDLLSAGRMSGEFSTGCYGSMFYGCTSLTSIPSGLLPATTLGNSCYQNMFYGCTSLTSIPSGLLPATTLAEGCYYGMFWGCTSLSSVPSDMLPATTLASICYGSMFCGCTSLTSIPSGLLSATTLTSRCYEGMFRNCTSLATVPSTLLPVATLSERCYYGMFSGCTSLSSVPSDMLPATTLSNLCYGSMFAGCIGLTTIPSGLLPATTLASSCYKGMFSSCTSLTSIPSGLLPATTLASSCYEGMFERCTNLTTAPELPAATLKDDCYKQMFHNCGSLRAITCLATDAIFYGTTSWVYGVASYGTFTKKAGVTWSSGDSGIPSGWTVVEV